MSVPRRAPRLPNVQPAAQVLIAALKNRRDLDLARDQHRYQLPASSTPPWPHAPRLGFYQTGRFSDSRWSIRYWAEVTGRESPAPALVTAGAAVPATVVTRQFQLGELQVLPQPIVSRWERRIVFIPTSFERLLQAREINDLFLGTDEEEALWRGLQQHGLPAERQLCLSIERERYLLSLALFCERGRINVECDSDHEMLTPDAVDAADARDDRLAHHGWSVLRFTGRAVREALPACLNLIRQTVTRQGGLLTPNGPHPAAAEERG